ncbi:thioredoxin family protein [Hymenobacter arizonensis]|uniref:Thioredoxin-like n=1 Tax=Hymenobacter arizonensis TaxID=1227077 RepID=A0A1I6AKV6_HYMAR|nr:thioredoxin family protein [Hymenobacter arizonensis]SFQ69294.1 Thioredoxin-like [Hymenobacter arizonensis]
MSFVSAIWPVRVAVLVLPLVSACSTQAQQPLKGKSTSSTAETTVKSAPQPTSPLSSSPQVILDYPVTSGTPQAPAAAWFSDLGAAQAQAKATNRPLVVVFSGSDWCQPCVVFEQEVFSQPAFAAYAQSRLVLAHFDYPRQAQNQPTPAQVKLNQAAAAQLNREGDFPLAVIVAPDGKVLAKTGYIPGGPAAFERYLNKIVGK